MRKAERLPPKSDVMLVRGTTWRFAHGLLNHKSMRRGQTFKDKWLESTMDEFRDDTTCLVMETYLVTAAKREKMDFMAMLHVWPLATVHEAQRESGGRLLGCRPGLSANGIRNDSRYDAGWRCRRRNEDAQLDRGLGHRCSLRGNTTVMMLAVDLLLGHDIGTGSRNSICDIYENFEGTPSTA